MSSAKLIWGNVLLDGKQQIHCILLLKKYFFKSWECPLCECEIREYAFKFSAMFDKILLQSFKIFVNNNYYSISKIILILDLLKK